MRDSGCWGLLENVAVQTPTYIYIHMIHTTLLVAAATAATLTVSGNLNSFYWFIYSRDTSPMTDGIPRHVHKSYSKSVLMRFCSVETHAGASSLSSSRSRWNSLGSFFPLFLQFSFRLSFYLWYSQTVMDHVVDSICYHLIGLCAQQTSTL